MPLWKTKLRNKKQKETVLYQDNIIVATIDEGVHVYHYCETDGITYQSIYNPIGNIGDASGGNHLCVHNNDIYYTNGSADLQKLTLTNNTLTLIDNYTPDDTYGTYSQGIYVYNKRAYLSLGSGGLDIVDTASMSRTASIKILILLNV